ncbi:MAG: UvrD-helicase domain-containing protein [Oligoflexia bacterium]|nr:UvrD-helicase domain-containing protein [Oligoflexia bacterium]
MQSEVGTSKHLFVIASAGSGKTTYLVEEALKIKDKNVLITTYTEVNDGEINYKIIEKNRSIPPNINIQTWFSMLIKHGARPYQGYLIEDDITGMILAQGQSAPFTKEIDMSHYFSRDVKVYSDKLAKFVIKCNQESKGKVISRIARIYSHIFIDEAQDLAGYDLDFVRLLCNAGINVVLVGDPRQGTFSTNNSAKNKKYRRYEIINYFEDSPIANLEIIDSLLTTNHRSIQKICDLADKLFPEFNKTKSRNNINGNHNGIFLIRKKDISKYIANFRPQILRDSKRTSVDQSGPVMNFGASKGLTFDRVLIYPTKPMVSWLKDNDSELADMSRAKFYVAITRARQSVGIVYDFKDSETIDGCEKYVGDS